MTNAIQFQYEINKTSQDPQWILAGFVILVLYNNKSVNMSMENLGATQENKEKINPKRRSRVFQAIAFAAALGGAAEGAKAEQGPDGNTTITIPALSFEIYEDEGQFEENAKPLAVFANDFNQHSQVIEDYLSGQASEEDALEALIAGGKVFLDYSNEKLVQGVTMSFATGEEEDYRAAQKRAEEASQRFLEVSQSYQERFPAAGEDSLGY